MRRTLLTGLSLCLCLSLCGSVVHADAGKATPAAKTYQKGYAVVNHVGKRVAFFDIRRSSIPNDVREGLKEHAMAASVVEALTKSTGHRHTLKLEWDERP